MAPRADHLGHHLREGRDGGADDRTSPEVGEGPAYLAATIVWLAGVPTLGLIIWTAAA
jgi:hypothetical protein